MGIEEILKEAVRRSVSDVFIVAGRAVSLKEHGRVQLYGERLMADETRQLLEEIYTLARRSMHPLTEEGDDDFSFAIGHLGRFRVNAYKQRGSMAAVIRVVQFELPEPSTLHIPESVMGLANENKGLILVTGPAGSGKSTSLACMIDVINNSRAGHIITLEDPIEFIHTHKQGIVSQREVEIDTKSYVSGLRAALREAPDVILLGEMRDLETISIAMTAAETGQLVLSTLHTLGAANTIDRIIDVFPPNQQYQVRVQLAMVLKAVVSQQLVTTTEEVRPVFEVMIVNQGIRNMIREGKVHQIDAMMSSMSSEGMQTMDNSLLNLYRQGLITKDQAKAYSITPENIVRKLV